MTTQTRRDFLRAFGAALATTIGAGLLPGCTPTPVITCYATLPNPEEVTAAAQTRTAVYPAWATLRQAWLDVREHRLPEEYAPLIESHQATLHALTAAGELDPAVAEQVQRAFAEVAAYYAEHSLPPTPVVMCYDMVEISPAPGESPAPAYCYTSAELQRGRAALVQEAVALEAMAAQSALDPATVDKARRALEQDIALFELVATFETLAADEHRRREDQLVAQYQGGRIDVPPEAVEAARILVALLAGGMRQ